MRSFFEPVSLWHVRQLVALGQHVMLAGGLLVDVVARQAGDFLLAQQDDVADVGQDVRVARVEAWRMAASESST